ncbi:MAG TPA: hypothetical protein VNQ99_06255 [Xanthobacteraceae bacterium]|nr:hypothetical protein [Xanthobacteraceae bacterium]
MRTIITECLVEPIIELCDPWTLAELAAGMIFGALIAVYAALGSGA